MRLLSGELIASDNYYYNSINNINGKNDKNINSMLDMEDYNFEYKIFTNQPKQKTFHWIILKKDSSLYGKAWSNIKNNLHK